MPYGIGWAKRCLCAVRLSTFMDCAACEANYPARANRFNEITGDSPQFFA